MAGLNIDKMEVVYLLTELPDGCPAIILQHPYAEKATRPCVVAVFANTETGHECAETLCDLKNSTPSPYAAKLVDARLSTAQAVQDAACNILERTGAVVFERMGKPAQKGGAE